MNSNPKQPNINPVINNNLNNNKLNNPVLKSMSGNNPLKDRPGKNRQNIPQVNKNQFPSSQPNLVTNPTFNKKNTCYCLATKHDYVTNCMNCGYILCSVDVKLAPTQKENDLQYYLCPFCQNKCFLPISMSSSVPSSSAPAEYAKKLQTMFAFDANRVKAYELKDRLLVYDREYAQRTVVYDAQGDYYNHGGSQWLSEKEKMEMALKEQKRIQRKQDAKKMRKVNINFDVMGRRIVEVTDPEYNDDDEDDVNQALQLCALDLDQCDDHYDTKQSAGVDPNDRGDDVIPVALGNNDLAYKNSKAGEIYRELRRGWEKI